MDHDESFSDKEEELKYTDNFEISVQPEYIEIENQEDSFDYQIPLKFDENEIDTVFLTNE